MSTEKETLASKARDLDNSIHKANDTTGNRENLGSPVVSQAEIDKTLKEILDKSKAEISNRLNILAVVKNFPVKSEFNCISKALADKFKVKVKDVNDLWRETFDSANTGTDEARQLQKFEIDVDPCKESVTPAFVAGEILKTLKEHIIFQDSEIKDAQAITCTLWVMANWCVDSFDFSPYLMITAPEKRCGKSQLLNLLANLSRKPLEAGNLTAPVLFRLSQKYKPTIFIDEVDSFLKKDEDLQGIIKCGIERGKALTWRVEKQPNGEQEVRGFDTFGFKAFSGISAQNISDTITDRSITISLRRKLTNETMPKVRDRSPAYWDKLNSQCARIALDYKDWLRAHKPEIPKSINDREADKWESLFSVADLIDYVAEKDGKNKHFGKTARRIAEIIANDDADMPVSIELLADIKTVFQNFAEWKKYVLTSELIELLTTNDEWRWAKYNRGNPMDARQLSKRLKPFGIKPNPLKEEDGKRGYRLRDFDDPFIRYLDGTENQDLS